MLQVPKIIFRLYLLFIFLLIATIATWGYNFGRGDQAEIIPYAYYLSDLWKDSYPLFLSNIISYFPNERYAVAYLLSIFGEGIPIATFILHLITTYFLIIGIYRIAKIYLKESSAFCVVWLMMLPLWGVNFGGNELYYNNFQASTISKAIGIWGVFYFLRNQVSVAFYFFSVSTIFHLLAGMQIGFLFLGVFFIKALLERKFPKIYFSQILFVLVALSYALLMKFSLDASEKILTDEQYFQAMFQWKFNEHYSTLDFQKFGFLLYFTSIISIFNFFHNQKIIVLFTILQLLGALVYWLGFYGFQSSTIVSLQWFKTTLWIKLFGVIACIGLLNTLYSKISKPNWLSWTGILHIGWILLFWKFNRVFLFIGTLGMITSVLQSKMSDKAIFIFLSWISFCGMYHYAERVPLDFGFHDDKIEFCKKIAQIPNSMTVIVPINFTELESYTKKNTYVNFIATPKKNQFFAEYLNRIYEVYGLKPKNFPIKKEIDVAKDYYHQKEWKEWQQFKSKGANYLVTENKNFEKIQPVLQVGKWSLWKL